MKSKSLILLLKASFALAVSWIAFVLFAFFSGWIKLLIASFITVVFLELLVLIIVMMKSVKDLSKRCPDY